MFCSLLTFSLNVVLEWLLGALCGNIRRFYEDSVVLKDSSLVSVIVLICRSLSFNLIVITSYFRTLGLHTPNNVHVVSLAVSDALVSAVSMPITAIRMSGNQQLITVLYFIPVKS